MEEKFAQLSIDRHPRDLFDVKALLEPEGFSNEIRRGFLYSLVCGDRPMHEILSPNFQDQRSVLETQFAGMAAEAFTYEQFEKTRKELVRIINRNLTAEDRRFLLSVKGLTPDWTIYEFERFPAVAWKLRNLQTLKATNPDKHRALYRLLEQTLDRSF